MSDPTTTAWQLLQTGLPPVPSGGELILRPTAAGPMALLRDAAGPPRVFVTDGTSVREVDPAADTGLPGATLLAQPAALRELLASRLGTVVRSDLVAWRPGRRAVLRLRTADGLQHWLKLFDAKSWLRAERAFDAAPRALSPMQLMVPSHRLPEHCGCVAPHAPGTSLRNLLAADTPLPLSLLARGVLALGYSSRRGALPGADFGKALTATLGSLEQGAAQRPSLQHLRDSLALLPAPPTPVRPGLVHGDLHDKQVFVGRDTLAAIDLEGMAWGDTRIDLANLAEHVRLRELQQHGTERGQAEQLLVRCGHDGDDDAMQRFRLLVRARLCGVYALRPRWGDLVEQLHQETAAWARRLS